MKTVAFIASSKTSFLHDQTDKKGSEYVDEIHLPEALKRYAGKEAYYSLFSFDESLLKQDYSSGGRTAKGYRGYHKCTLDWAVFDFDSEKDPSLALADAEKLAALAQGSRIWFSGSKGYHVYIPTSAFGADFNENPAPGKALDFIVSKLCKNYTTLDTGIYDIPRKIRAPGSLHPKTGKLKLLIGRDDMNECPFAHAPIVDPSAPLSDLYFEYSSGQSVSVESGMGEEDSAFISELKQLKEKPCIDRMLLRTYGEGSRHQALMILVSDMFHRGMKGSEIKTRMMPWMLTNGMTSRQGELTSAIKQLEEGASYMFGCKEPLRAEECSAKCAMFPKLSGSTLAARDSLPHDADEKAVEKAETKSALARIKKFAAMVVREYGLIHYAEKAEIYRYKDGYYSPVPPMYLEVLFEANMKSIASNKNVKEFTGSVARAGLVTEEKFGHCRRRFMNFKNGVFDKERNELVDRDPQKHFFTYILPCDYDPSAKAPRWERLLNEVFYDKASGTVDQELINLLEAFIGYTLSGNDPHFHQAMFLVGRSGANGKSTILDLVGRILGDSQASTHMGLKELSISERRINLIGKLANLKADEERLALVHNEGIFKELIAGDPVSARKLGHSQVISFRPHAKLWFSFNDLPQTNDDSGGFLRRLVVIPFDNQFLTPSAYAEVPDEKKGKGFYERDTDIGDKLMEELPGIFNRAWAAYQKAKGLKELPPSKAVRAVIQEYRETNDPTLEVLERIVEPDPGSWTPNHDLFAAYRIAAEPYGRFVLDASPKKISMALQSHFKAQALRKNVGRGHLGIKLKPGVGQFNAGGAHEI